MIYQRNDPFLYVTDAQMLTLIRRADVAAPILLYVATERFTARFWQTDPLPRFLKFSADGRLLIASLD